MNNLGRLVAVLAITGVSTSTALAQERMPEFKGYQIGGGQITENVYNVVFRYAKFNRFQVMTGAFLICNGEVETMPYSIWKSETNMLYLDEDRDMNVDPDGKIFGNDISMHTMQSDAPKCD